MRLIDLSHNIIPGQEKYRTRIDEYSVDEYIPEYTVEDDQWYVMQDVLLCTHIGTHAEAPYHALKTGVHSAEMDLKHLVGMASILDFVGKGYQQPISLEEVRQRGAHIRKGDIVIVKTGLAKHYGTALYKRPYLMKDAVEWLVNEMEISALGVDCSGIENRAKGNSSECHLVLFEKGIPILEDLNNVEYITNKRVFFYAMPLKIAGTDASWIRPVVVDDEEISLIIEEKLKSAEWIGTNVNDR